MAILIEMVLRLAVIVYLKYPKPVVPKNVELRKAPESEACSGYSLGWYRLSLNPIHRTSRYGLLYLRSGGIVRYCGSVPFFDGQP
jgi:hypothetical protein